MADVPEFDPSKPFEAVGGSAPEFDPSKPFEPVMQQPSGVEGATPLREGAGWGEAAKTAVTNVVPSAIGFGKAVAAPLGDVAELGARGIDWAAQKLGAEPRQAQPMEVTESLSSLGKGILEKAGMKESAGNEKYADAVGRFFADRYGGIENVKKTLAEDPVGILADLSTAFTGGGLGVRAAGLAGTASGLAKAARLTDPLTLAGKAARPIGKAASELLGVTTGAGPEAIQIAGRAGLEGGEAARAFRENIRGKAPMEEVVADAQRSLDNLYQKRGRVYREEMAALPEKNVPLDFNKIDKAIEESGVIKTFGKGVNKQDLSPATAEIRQKMTDVIEEWKQLPRDEFHTLEGMDALKQKLGNVMDSTQPRTPERTAAGKIYNSVRQTIVDWDPKYAKIMKGYEEATGELKNLQRELSIPFHERGNVNTSLRKLQAALRNNVSTAYGNRRELAQFIADNGSPQLIEKLAGQSLHSWAPRGIARSGAALLAEVGAYLIGSGAAPHLAPMAAAGAMASPRLVGEAAYWGGAGLGTTRPFAMPGFQTGRLQNITGAQGFKAGGRVTKTFRISK